jgi:acyl-CoA synthetase (AMP-forming)/AMP-acid ligase II
MNSIVLSLPDDISENPAVILPAADGANPLSFSYSDIDRTVKKWRLVLSRIGIEKGSKVVFVLPNGIEVVVAFLAVVGLSSIAVPVNPQYKEVEYAELFKLIKPSLLVTSKNDSAKHQHESVLSARALGIPVARCSRNITDLELEPDDVDATRFIRQITECEIFPEDPALLLHTSGTTGAPKGVMLTHENILVSMRIIIHAHKLSSSDRCMLITPLFHVAGLCASLLCTLFSGGCAIIPPSLPGNFWQQFKDYKATWFHGVPEQMPAIRFMRSGGSDLDLVTFERLEKEFQAPVLEIYGMTETAPGIFCNTFGYDRRLGHYPIPDTVEVKILSGEPAELKSEVGLVGEICVRGRNVMSGYVNNPVANKSAFVDGFFRTGDLGAIREGNFLQLTGRIKDVINKGGEKISPSEVENVALAHDSVREAVCFKIPDDIYGEEIGKFIIICSCTASSLI